MCPRSHFPKPRAAAVRPRRFSGFTLVELLVVLAVVGILLAVLFPVLSAARERARRATCLSNLRQLAAAIGQYVQDSGGVYPLDHTTAVKGGVTYLVHWDNLVYPYVKNDQTFRCPDQPADAPWVTHGALPGADGPPYTDYTYDAVWLNVFLPPYPTKNVRGAQEAALATPATIWLNVDEGWISPDGEEHFWRKGSRTSCSHLSGGSTLHSGGGDYSFADGHVQWLTPEAAGEVECKNGPLPAPFQS